MQPVREATLAGIHDLTRFVHTVDGGNPAPLDQWQHPGKVLVFLPRPLSPKFDIGNQCPTVGKLDGETPCISSSSSPSPAMSSQGVKGVARKCLHHGLWKWCGISSIRRIILLYDFCNPASTLPGLRRIADSVNRKQSSMKARCV